MRANSILVYVAGTIEQEPHQVLFVILKDLAAELT